MGLLRVFQAPDSGVQSYKWDGWVGYGYGMEISVWGDSMSTAKNDIRDVGANKWDGWMGV